MIVELQRTSVFEEYAHESVGTDFVWFEVIVRVEKLNPVPRRKLLDPITGSVTASVGLLHESYPTSKRSADFGRPVS
jgi:hypothetical protein